VQELHTTSSVASGSACDWATCAVVNKPPPTKADEPPTAADHLRNDRRFNELLVVPVITGYSLCPDTVV